MHIQSAEDYGVKFGRAPDMGLEGQKAFPFIYTFVNHNDDTWQPVSVGTQPSLANICKLVPAGQTTIVNVLLDPDYNFKFLGAKFTAYYWQSRDDKYTWYDYPTTLPNFYIAYFDNTAALPVGPSDGDTYRALVTANGWTINHYYRYSSTLTAWVDITTYTPSGTIETQGIPVYDNTVATPTNPTVGDTYVAYTTNAGWTANNVYKCSVATPVPMWQNITTLVNANGMSDGMQPDMQWLGIPYTNYLAVTLSIQGSSSNLLYGGNVQGVSTLKNAAFGGLAGNQERGFLPVPISLLQGYESGHYRVRTPYLIPRQAVMTFQIKNYHPTNDIYVGAMIYGMKIRL